MKISLLLVYISLCLYGCAEVYVVNPPHQQYPGRYCIDSQAVPLISIVNKDLKPVAGFMPTCPDQNGK